MSDSRDGAVMDGSARLGTDTDNAFACDVERKRLHKLRRRAAAAFAGRCCRCCCLGEIESLFVSEFRVVPILRCSLRNLREVARYKFS